MNLFQRKTKETHPVVSGLYDTDKGNLYWDQVNECWTKGGETMFPQYWYEETVAEKTMICISCGIVHSLESRKKMPVFPQGFKSICPKCSSSLFEVVKYIG